MSSRWVPQILCDSLNNLARKTVKQKNAVEKYVHDSLARLLIWLTTCMCRSMYVGIYLHVCMDVGMYVCTCLGACMSMFMCVGMCVCVVISLHVYKGVKIYLYVRA